MVLKTTFSAVDKFSSIVDKIKSSVTDLKSTSDVTSAKIDRKFRKIGESALDVSKKSAILGTSLSAPLGLVANEAIKFEDALSDVGKTTGLKGKQLDILGESILDLSTTSRSSITDILKIAEIGGQLGVSTKDLKGFTEASNKFAVALGSDYGGTEEAITQVGKIQSLFADTRKMNIADVITKTGSAINELGAKGSGTSANINDFILRIGQLPDALKPSLVKTASLGTFFEESGLKAEIASGGLTNLFLTAGKNIGSFASQMKISTNEAKSLLKSDPSKFAVKFSESLKGLNPDQLAVKLDKLKVGSQETIKVVGSLGNGQKRLSELFTVSNEAFKSGISLNNEYNTKNETTQAQIEKSKNNFQALGIIIGTQLLPVVSDLVKSVIPIIKNFTDWIKNNKDLTKKILITTSVIAGLSFAISGISAIVSVFSSIMAVTAIRIALVTTASYLFSGAITVLSVAFTILTSPITLIVLGIVALGFAIIGLIKYWNQLSNAVLILLGPLGLVISFFKSLYNNWELVKESFSSGGILEGFKSIGKVVLDSILAPIQQVLEIVDKLTGSDWSKTLASNIKDFRADLGLNVDGEQQQVSPVVNSSVIKQESLQKSITERNQNVNINVKDQTGRATVEQDNYFVPVRLTSSYVF